MKNFLKDSKGFTMAEVLVVVGIIGILAGIGMPGLLKYYNTLVFKRTSRDIVSELNMARFRAISKNRMQRIVFTLSASAADTYRLQDCPLGVCANATDRGLQTIKTAVDIIAPTANFTIDFYPTGNSTQKTITLKNMRSGTLDTIDITINGNTGAIIVS